MSSDADRFRSLFDEHVRSVLAYAVRRVDQRADAADVVAEVFMVAWRRIDVVPGGSEARPWLFGVARNVVANQRRTVRRRDRLVERMRSELLAGAGPADTSPVEVESVREAMLALSTDDREVLRLACWEGLSPAEIALAYGIASGSARSRLSRARQRLRDQLDRGPRSETAESMAAAVERVARSTRARRDHD